MLVTDYYKFKKGNGESRYDEVFSTGCYSPFESLRNKRGELLLHLHEVQTLFDEVYMEDMPFFCLSKSHDSRCPEEIITPVDGLEIPASLCGYGDIQNDAMLLVLGELTDTMELFIARGYWEHTSELYSFLKEGQLLVEIESIKKRGRAC